ncbi:MAG: TIGR03557 family F420-dependent LLM class oxidoreductase [Actinomycetota bacterium]|nr:TIGR03557 family F420-dependent LLM class oxidoreductase [Actinomycetota bacterium]
MIEIGYKLSSEEHGPADLVRYARRAEEAGFAFAAISDHFHPWTDKQGHSPFVWAVLGGISQATQELRVLTGVTCPSIRVHPVIVAQAAATAAVMFEGRFTLGLGTGENLNEHITAQRWPALPERLEMLEEAVQVIRGAWDGGLFSHRGRHYTVENARIYDLPRERIPIAIAGTGPKSAGLAGRVADGFVGLAPDEDLLDMFSASGGEAKPRYAEVNVCWAEKENEARSTVMESWPMSGIKGQLMQELALTSDFAAAGDMVTEEDVMETVVVGPDPEAYLAELRKFSDAGYDHIWLHQIGPDQEGFFDFFERQIAPKL